MLLAQVARGDDRPIGEGAGGEHRSVCLLAAEAERTSSRENGAEAPKKADVLYSTKNLDRAEFIRKPRREVSKIEETPRFRYTRWRARRKCN